MRCNKCWNGKSHPMLQWKAKPDTIYCPNCGQEWLRKPRFKHAKVSEGSEPSKSRIVPKTPSFDTNPIRGRPDPRPICGCGLPMIRQKNGAWICAKGDLAI